MNHVLHGSLTNMGHVTMATNEGDNALHEVTHKIGEVTGHASEIVTLLKHQLAESKEREEWLKTQVDELRQMQYKLIEDKTPKKRRKFLGIF